MKVVHGPEGVETTTMQRERRGNLTVGLGMTADKTLIMDIKTMVWVGVDFTVTRSALLPVTPVPTSSSSVSTLVSPSQTFIRF